MLIKFIIRTPNINDITKSSCSPGLALKLLPFATKFFNSDINDTQIETALKTLKLDNYLNKKVGTLSFGETKKLEFLRLIMENKKVWILDEPLSNLDEDSIELMKQTFEDHCSKQGSIIFSSHQNPGIYVTEEINL